MPVSATRCILRRTTPVRPETGTPHRHLGRAAPAPLARPRTSRPPMRPPSTGAPPPTSASRRSIVTYVDRTLNCVDCGVEFIHSAADQEYYVQKGFVSDPKRCTSCRASRRAARDGGYDVREIGGPRGYERGDDRPNREYFAVVCSSCGNQAQVPFKPRMDRPVYCSDCFRTVKPGLTCDLATCLDARRSRAGRSRRRDSGSRWRPRQTRDPGPRRGPASAPSRPTTAVSSSMPSTTEPRGAWSAISARQRLRPRVVVGHDRGARREPEARAASAAATARAAPGSRRRGRRGPSPRPSSRPARRRARAPPIERPADGAALERPRAGTPACRPTGR